MSSRGFWRRCTREAFTAPRSLIPLCHTKVGTGYFLRIWVLSPVLRQLLDGSCGPTPLEVGKLSVKQNAINKQPYSIKYCLHHVRLWCSIASWTIQARRMRSPHRSEERRVGKEGTCRW